MQANIILSYVIANWVCCNSHFYSNLMFYCIAGWLRSEFPRWRQSMESRSIFANCLGCSSTPWPLLRTFQPKMARYAISTWRSQSCSPQTSLQWIERRLARCRIQWNRQSNRARQARKEAYRCRSFQHSTHVQAFCSGYWDTIHESAFFRSFAILNEADFLRVAQMTGINVIN